MRTGSGPQDGTPIELLMHGACGCDFPNTDVRNMKGADRWAHEWGMANLSPDDLFPTPAKWSWAGKRAGRERNRDMVNCIAVMFDLRPRNALCLAFPGGSGTADCVRRARAAGIPRPDYRARGRAPVRHRECRTCGNFATIRPSKLLNKLPTAVKEIAK